MGIRGTPDRQLILQFLTGVGDGTIWRSTNALAARAAAKGVKSHTVTLRPGNMGRRGAKAATALLERKAPKLTASSRVYLDGHGDWMNQTLGGATAEEIAGTLASIELPDGILISVLGCQLGRDLSSPGYGLIGHSIDSFASNLHRMLGEDCLIKTVVFARVQSAGTRGWGDLRGHKGVFANEGDDHATLDLEKSKVCFWWEGNKQLRGWANYAAGRIDVIDDD